MASSTVRVQFLGDSSSAVRATKSVERGFGGLGRAASIAGAAITAGIVGGLAAAVKAAISFDREMRNSVHNREMREAQRTFEAHTGYGLYFARKPAQG